MLTKNHKCLIIIKNKSLNGCLQNFEDLLDLPILDFKFKIKFTNSNSCYLFTKNQISILIPLRNKNGPIYLYSSPILIFECSF